VVYEELHRRYGPHVSQRVRRELSPSEFGDVLLDNLTAWLAVRAETAHETYRNLLNNPLAASEDDAQRTGTACRRWREAEDLSYLVAIADDVSGYTRAG
jgi:hypothetical protein